MAVYKMNPARKGRFIRAFVLSRIPILGAAIVGVLAYGYVAKPAILENPEQLALYMAIVVAAIAAGVVIGVKKQSATFDSQVYDVDGQGIVVKANGSVVVAYKKDSIRQIAKKRNGSIVVVPSGSAKKLVLTKDIEGFDQLAAELAELGCSNG